MQNRNIGEATLDSKYFISLGYDSDGAYIQVEDSNGGVVLFNPQIRGKEAEMLYAEITDNPEVSFGMKRREEL